MNKEINDATSSLLSSGYSGDQIINASERAVKNGKSLLKEKHT